MPCSPFKVYLRFGGALRLQLQVRRICRARDQREASSKQSLRHILPKLWLTFTGLHGVISQKMELLVIDFCFWASTLRPTSSWCRFGDIYCLHLQDEVITQAQVTLRYTARQAVNRTTGVTTC
jgi:hypothetical protein